MLKQQEKKSQKQVPLGIKIVIMVLVAEGSGAIGSFFTLPSIASWYGSIAKPWLSPPNWVFGPVWILLYALMGIAAALVWNATANKREALTLYGIQLVLNVVWSFLFFGLHSPLLAFIEILVLWSFIALTARAFYQIKKKAGIIFIPYIVWVTVAAILNLAVWLLNA